MNLWLVFLRVLIVIVRFSRSDLVVKIRCGLGGNGADNDGGDGFQDYRNCEKKHFNFL